MERFINQKVIIKKNGVNTEGILESISQEDGFIYVKTSQGERGFSFNAIINGTVMFVDEELQSVAIPFFTDLKELLEKLEDEKAEAAIEQAKNNFISRVRREIGDSNVAFKCTFCNGGASSTSVGFKAPCSPEVREFNVKNREWCGSNPCRCRKLLDEEITQEEFDEKAYTENKMEFLCYESRMLINWVCYAGMTQKTGEPMALNKAQVGSLAVLTTRPVIDGREVPQERTQVFGVFLIGEHNDKSSIGGSATAHPKYRIELTPSESEQILFWKYHSNPENPYKAFWGTGLHRYLSDMVCCQILKDIVDVINDPDRKALAQELLDKFKKETGIQNIEPPSGPIA